jgi:hypothetical protein
MVLEIANQFGAAGNFCHHIQIDPAIIAIGGPIVNISLYRDLALILLAKHCSPQS